MSRTETQGFKDYIEKAYALNSGRTVRVYVRTFGCQQNEADSERILGMAREMGYTETDTPDEADLIVVNTCAIREHAEMKALSLLGGFKARKRQSPDTVIAVVGCMAAEPAVAQKIKEDFHYVSFTLEPSSLDKFPELVFGCLAGGKRRFLLPEDNPEITEGLPVSRRSAHSAWVSIMYGCNNFCSYCIVPYVRGRERSRDSGKILEECSSLVSSGVKEITLLGQNVNSYRSDITFPELLSRVAEIDGDFIIRFMTSHPKDTSDELISVLAKHKGKIAPFFHLPLQSGSDRILKAMNRTYTVGKFTETVEKLRRAVDGIALSTDVIVGFPGESDGDFEDTLEVVKKLRFDNVYSFIYSPRSGTRAEKMEGQLSQSVKVERLERLLSLSGEIAYEKNLSYLSKTLRVLVDSSEGRDGKTVYTGRSGEGKLIHFTAENATIGEFLNVKIIKVGAFDLIGTEDKGEK
ncbi:MAG: tRNA (N6-isopentenyl adenosine(37)-C2)-methylthiotransferase MiaB [Clostridia bacterium]|nr:tRNA (N6-isopentenyl adenosine(37)-C2)-methylthiotransferase MiaB [Clostridia bacterium]